MLCIAFWLWNAFSTDAESLNCADEDVHCANVLLFTSSKWQKYSDGMMASLQLFEESNVMVRDKIKYNFDIVDIGENGTLLEETAASRKAEGKVDVMICPYSSTYTKNCKAAACDNKIPAIATGAAARSLYEGMDENGEWTGERACEYLISHMMIAPDYFGEMFTILKTANAKTVTVLTEGKSFTRSLRDGVLQKIEDAGNMEILYDFEIESATAIEDIPYDNITNTFDLLTQETDILVGLVYSALCVGISKEIKNREKNYKASMFTICMNSGDMNALGKDVAFYSGPVLWIERARGRAYNDDYSNVGIFAENPDDPVMDSPLYYARELEKITGRSTTYQDAGMMRALYGLHEGFLLVKKHDMSIKEAMDTTTMKSFFGYLQTGNLGYDDMAQPFFTQYDASGDGQSSITSPTIYRERQLIYPMPQWDERDCWNLEFGDSQCPQCYNDLCNIFGTASVVIFIVLAVIAVGGGFAVASSYSISFTMGLEISGPLSYFIAELVCGVLGVWSLFVIKDKYLDKFSDEFFYSETFRITYAIMMIGDVITALFQPYYIWMLVNAISEKKSLGFDAYPYRGVVETMSLIVNVSILVLLFVGFSNTSMVMSDSMPILIDGMACTAEITLILGGFGNLIGAYNAETNMIESSRFKSDSQKEREKRVRIPSKP